LLLLWGAVVRWGPAAEDTWENERKSIAIVNAIARGRETNTLEDTSEEAEEEAAEAEEEEEEEKSEEDVVG
jgi:hypothetical protein